MLLDFLEHLTCSSTRQRSALCGGNYENDQVNLHMIIVQINEYYFLVTGKGLVNMRTFSSLYYK